MPDRTQAEADAHIAEMLSLARTALDDPHALDPALYRDDSPRDYAIRKIDEAIDALLGEEVKMFTLKIETGNAAFADDPGPEIARLLEVLADKFARGIPTGKASIRVRDVNGNTVGRAELTTEEG